MPYPYKNNEQIKQGSAENKVLVTDNTNQEKQIKENNDNAVNNNDENIDPNYNIMTLEEPVVDTTMQTQKNTDNTDQNNNLNFDKTINKNIIENNKNNNTTSNKNLNENNANVNIKELPKQLTKDIKEQPKENEFERNQLAGHKVDNDHNKPKIEGHRHREIN